MRLTILGKHWSFRFVRRLARDALGQCDHPNAQQKEIRVLKGLPQHEELDVTLHELLHAGNWSLDEEHVDRLASDMAAALWKLGWRKGT